VEKHNKKRCYHDQEARELHVAEHCTGYAIQVHTNVRDALYTTLYMYISGDRSRASFQSFGHNPHSSSVKGAPSMLNHLVIGQ
jgi:hypothetical protein